MNSKKLFVLTMAALLAGGALSVTSCKKKSTSNTPFAEKEKAEMVDYVSQLTFNENSGRKYRKIKSVKSLIDGDTSHFYLDDYSDFPTESDTYSDGIIKVRYLGIDTPESTGQVEEWGKTASKFNKSKLSNAESIIVESNDDKWNLDSTGGRFLCYVWYRNSATEPYRNLNLELLQEGLCYAKTLINLNADYTDVFQKAFAQANAQELYVFSKAASSWTFDNDMNIIESNGWIVGTKTDTSSVISMDKNDLASVNALKVYKDAENGTIATTKDINNEISDIEGGTTTDKLQKFYLGTEIKGKTYYYTGEVSKGLGTLSEDYSKAMVTYIDVDSTKNTTCYNIYTVNSEDVKEYVTINSSNNLAFMERDANFYYGQYKEVSIKALRSEADSFVGTLVRFEGVISKVSGQTFYVQDEDEDTGLTFGMAVYMGYNFTGQSIVAVGNRLSICGTFSNDSDYGAQVSGLEYMRMKPNYAKNTRLISTGNTFTIKEITGEDLANTEANDDYDGLSYAQTLTNTTVTMSDLSVESVYTTGESSSSAGAMTLTCKDKNGDSVSIRTEVLYKEDNKTKVTEDDLKGKTISVKGLVDSYNGKYQVRVYTWSDITVK